MNGVLDKNQKTKKEAKKKLEQRQQDTHRY